MKLIMTKGLPGSGKSTWAKQFCKDNPTYVRINKDSLRSMIGSYSIRKENLIVKMRDALIHATFKEGKNVVLDDTNLDPKHEFNMRKIINEWHGEFEIKSFTDVTLATCIKQDLKRLESVGRDVILKMHKQYLVPKNMNTWSHDPTLPDAIICDIDGTLAMHVARGPYEMEKCETDAVDQTVLALLKTEYEKGRTILFVSGRGEEYRDKTEKWLEKHVRPKNVRLYMRPLKDTREDSIIKQEIFDREIKRKYNIMFVLDDRNRVVDMWRRNGLKCLQVAEGDF